MNRRLLVVIVMLGLGASACTDATLRDVTAALESTDLKSSKDTGEQAAGASAAETEKIAKADRAVDEALESREPLVVDRAVKLRPRDARYVLYRGLISGILGGDTKIAGRDEKRARELLKAQLPNAGEDEFDRRWHELLLETMGRTVTSLGGAPRSALFKSLYCQSLGRYETNYGSMADGQMYLQFVNRDPCPRS